MNRNQLSAELRFLQEEADALGPVKNAGLGRQLENTATALRAEDTRLNARARAALAEVETNLLKRGRGPLAAAEDERWLKARAAFEAGGEPGAAIVVAGDSPYRGPRPGAPAPLRVLTDNALRGSEPAQAPKAEIRIPVNGRVPPIADFQSLFPKADVTKNRWTRSFEGVMQDLHRAPGGVVVDARLPAVWNQRIEELKADASRGLSLRINGTWVPVEPRADAETLRLAFAFVKDERVMPIDLRNLNVAETLWLAQQIAPEGNLGRSDYDRIFDALAALTAVNVHPALRDTSLALAMVRVDQFIFDLLPDQLDPAPLNGASVRFGLDVARLRELYLADFHNISNANSWRSLFQKSIVSVVGVAAESDGERIRIEPSLKFAIYRLPAAKSDGPVIRLDKSTAWLQQHESQLKKAHVLDPLIRFAAASAVIRTALENKIPNNLDALMAVPVEEHATPRLLCRPEGRKPCKLELLQ